MRVMADLITRPSFRLNRSLEVVLGALVSSYLCIFLREQGWALIINLDQEVKTSFISIFSV